MSLRIPALLPAVFVLMLTVSPAHASAGDDFHALLDEHWTRARREQIFFRSDPDAWRMNGKLADFTDDAYERRRTYNDAVLSRLDEIDPAMLSRPDRISYRVFRYERLTEQQSYAQPDRYFPINALFGYHTYFAEAPASMAFLDADDYDRYLVSLADFPRYNREHIALLREAVRRGYTQHCQAMQGYEETIARHTVKDPRKSTLYEPFQRFPGSIAPAERERYTRRGAELISLEVAAAYRELLRFYSAEYAPYCREKAGIDSVPGGEAYYRYLLRYFTTTDMTPREIHELGKTELARIRGEMDGIISQLKFDGDFREFLAWLRNDPSFYAGSSRELLGRAALIAKTAEGELPRFFTVLPRGTYNVKGNPGRGAYYMPSSGDGTTPGTYFVGTGDLRAQPLYALTALTLHEGVPGHHLQTALAFELDLPPFRRSVYHSAYGEGWGLYSERLGVEMGMYTDPYENFGRLTYEAWRACRLIVDTGLHAFDWTRDEAVSFMLANTGLTKPEIENEVDRYITWPAQATSYKIGEIRIRALRAKAEDVLGPRFDIRRFHDQIVGNGSLPIALLEEVVGEWIAERDR